MKKITKMIYGLGFTFAALYSIPTALYINRSLNNNYLIIHNGNEIVKSKKNDNAYLLDGKNSEEKAKFIELGFYKNAIYGFDFKSDEEAIKSDNPGADSILTKYSPLKDTGKITKEFYSNIHMAYTEYTIIKNTDLSGVSFSEYISSQIMANKALAINWIPILEEEYETSKEFFSDTTFDKDKKIVALEQLDSTIDFDLAANKFIYQTLYLFQESVNREFDYKITAQLKTLKPMLMWYASFTNTGDWLNDDTENFTTIEDLINGGSGSSGTINGNVNNDENILGDIGFEGIINKSSSSLTLIDDVWTYDNSWIINPIANEWSTASSSFFSNSVNVEDLPFYKVDDSIINLDSSWVDGWTLKAKTLYPFIFGLNYQDSSSQSPGYADAFYYSIFANTDSDGNFVKTDNVTKESKSIIDVIFPDTAKKWEKEFVTILLIDDVISNNSRTMLNTQYFWKDKGYYIELSGKMKTIYETLIDEGIQK